MSEKRHSSAAVSRRQLLMYGGAVAVLGLLSGCRSDGHSSETVQPDVEANSLSNAQQLAGEYQTALNRDGVTRGVQLLAGTVRQAASNNEPAYDLYNPILLATAGDSAPDPDDAGEFLNGCVIGVQVDDPAGAIIIRPIVYNADIHSLSRDQPDVVVLHDVDLRAVYVGVDQPEEHLEMIAFGTDGGAQLAAQDGTPIKPGLEIQVS